jgi:hypothetical protein
MRVSFVGLGVMLGLLGLASRSSAQAPGDGSIDPRLAQPVRPGTVQPVLRTARQFEPKLQLPGEAPRFLRVTGTTARTVSLVWSPTSGSSGYWVHSADTTGKFYRGSALVTDTMTTVTYLLPGTFYSFKVSATYPAETQRSEAFSDLVSGRTAAAPAPRGLAAKPAEKGGVSLTWERLPGADWYRLYRDGAFLADIKPAPSENSRMLLRNWYDDPVLPGRYQYQIQAVYLATGAQAVSAVVPDPPVAIQTY